jgi:hypothetical protein
MIAFIFSLLISLGFRPEQFPRLAHGLTESLPFFLNPYRWNPQEFSEKRLSKELMLDFGKLLSTVLDNVLRRNLTDYLAITFRNDCPIPNEPFSYVPCRSLLRLLCCGGDYVTPSILNVMQRVLLQVGSEKLCAVKVEGLWHILIALLGHSSADVVESTSGVMLMLAQRSWGNDYAEFLENHFFEELIQRLPSPELTTVEVPLPAEDALPSTNFTALGTTWLALCFSFFFF